MKTAEIHPNWLRPPQEITDGFSLEITANDVNALRTVAPLIPAQTPIAVAFLPKEGLDGRVAAAGAVRQLGFEPMPHFSARRLHSHKAFKSYLDRAVNDAGIKRCFVIAGDSAEAAGPFQDTSELIATGEFERAGITALGVGGHPEGHRHMTQEQCWRVLQQKCRDIENRGMASFIVTQFGFDPQLFLHWLEELRSRGIDSPVRIGVPGPAGVATLIRFAARCGVTASAAAMSRYGISLNRLVSTAGPAELVHALAAGLLQKHGPVRLHFYPFGGLERTVSWIKEYAASTSSQV